MANINGFKEYMDYFAALEVCLSLAEENIALETELLHYGSEYSELEKCFNELLKLCKSDSVIGPDMDIGYFRVKTETIERKWKQCKMKSLLMRGMAKRSPLSVVQSHFSRVFPNASSFMANDRLMSDTFPGLHRDTMSTKGFKLHHNNHRDFYNDFSTLRNISHSNSGCSNTGTYRLSNHALDLIKGPMSRRSGLSDLIPSHIVNHRVKTLNRLPSGPGSSSSVLDSASEICQTLMPISSHAQRTGRGKENCNSSSSLIGSTVTGSVSISQSHQQHQQQQQSTRRKMITKRDHPNNSDTHNSESALQILDDEQCLDDVDFKDYDDPDDSLECYLPASINFSENLTFRRGKPAHPLPDSCNQPREVYRSDGHSDQQLQEAQQQLSSSRQHHHQRTTAILDGSGVMCYNGEQVTGNKEADTVVDGEKKSKLSKFLLKKWMPHSIFRHKSGSKSSLITSSDWNEAEYNSLPNSSSSTSSPIKSPTSTSHRNHHPSHPSQCVSDSSHSKMNPNCNADSNSMSTKNDPNCGPSSCDGLESRMSTSSSGPSSSCHAGNDNNTANRLESTSQSTSDHHHHHPQSTVTQHAVKTTTASIPSYKSSSSPDLPKALTGLSSTLPASEAHPNTQFTLDARNCEENAFNSRENGSSRDYDDVYSSSSKGNGQSPTQFIASEPLLEKIVLKDCGTGSDQSVKSSSSLSPIAQVIPNGSGSDNNNTNDSIHEAGILPKSFFSLKSVKKAKIKELTPIKLHDQVIPENSSLQITKPAVISSAIHHHRRNLYEKKHGSRSSRNLRRRKNATRAWYDLSDDEDGLGTGCRNSRALVPTIQETI